MDRRSFFKRLGGLVAAGTIAPLIKPKPRGLFNPIADISKQYKEGMSLRHIRQFNPNTGLFTTRMDVLYGVAMQKPEYSVRILG